MKNYINLLLGILLIISSIKPFFGKEIEKSYDILGFDLPQYLYILLHFFLGAILLVSFLKERNQDKNM